eukprot:gene7115-9473_t
MAFSTWITFVIAASIIAVSPGSGAVLSMSHGLSYGVRKASGTILGLQAGLLLVLAIQAAGAALPVLIIGTIPLWIMLLGKPAGLRWRSLVPGLLLTVAGMALMMQATAHGQDDGVAPDLWLGIFYAVLAMLSWTAFGLLNARWLSKHPEVNSTLWANWLGVA